jgi:tetratricopeptide (TPR) repeat protein
MILDPARELFERHEWKALAALLEARPRAEVVASPQLGYWLADAWRRLGRHAEALALLEEITPAIKRSGIPRLTLFALNLLGMIRFETGEVQAAEDAWKELLSEASGAKDEEFVARANNNLGIICTLHVRPKEAVTCYERAIAAYRMLGLPRQIAQSHQNLAITYRALFLFEEAENHFEAAIRYATEDKSEDELARAEQERALLIYLSNKDSRMAKATVYRALGRFTSLGDPIGHADSLRVLAMIEKGEGEIDPSRQHAREALKVAQETHHTLLEAEVLEVLGEKDRAEEKFASIGASEWGFHFREVLERIS